MEATDAAKDEDKFDQEAVWGFAGLTPLVFTLLALLTVWAQDHWHDPQHFHTGYVLCGGIALVWIMIPSLIAILIGRDAPFPTLFRTVTSFEDWLKRKCLYGLTPLRKSA